MNSSATRIWLLCGLLLGSLPPASANQGASPDLIGTSTGSLFVPKTPQAFLYDSDGNLTNDGRWTLSWDTENRLAHMGTGTSIATNARFGLEFKYDYQGRRISKVVSNWVGSGWNKLSERRFLYDGMNLIAVLDGANAILQSFHWGTDLSGQMGPAPDSAGGVGGLLAMTVYTGSNAGTYFYAYDGKGNVIGLISASDGSIVAQYEYGPFGELLRATGPLAKENPFRFSTKYQDDETDFSYYGYRYYCASTGQWLNRDPLGEAGGLNLYAFVANDPVNQVDVAGLWGVQFGAASPNIGVGQSTFTFDLDTYKQTVGSALDAAFGHDLGLHYDRCDPALASTRGLAAASGTALSIFGPLRAAQWAAAGTGLLRAGTGLGLSAFEVYQSAEAVSEGYQAIQQGNPLGFVLAGLGLWGLKAGVPALASSAGRLARSVEGALARRAAKGTDFMAGRLGGRLYDAGKLAQLEGYLGRRGVTLRVGDEFLPAGKVGGFNAGERTLSLRSNPTQYEVWHELSHFRQFQRLGPEAYMSQSLVQKEQFVFDLLNNSPKRWNGLNFDQQQHAIQYILEKGGMR